MTFKQILTLSTIILSTAFTVVPSGTALAQGGNDPIPGIDIIMKEDPSQAPIKPFSLTGEEVKQINSIKGPERLALVLKAVTKRVKTDEGFVKSGMEVMGKDWCGECPWPEKISYKFQNGKTTYRLDMMLSDGTGDYWLALARSKEGMITDRDFNALNEPLKSNESTPESTKMDIQFDEADALFSKRGEVKDARDRYATPTNRRLPTGQDNISVGSKAIENDSEAKEETLKWSSENGSAELQLKEKE